LPRVALDQRVQGVRQSEHDMVVAGRQELAAACLDPALLGQRLALGTMAVTAGVIAQGDSTAAVTGLEVATHGLGAAGLDRPHGARLAGARAVALAIGFTVTTEQHRDLEPHRLWRGAHGWTGAFSCPAGRGVRSWSSDAARSGGSSGASS
jgi:uncharacterized Zn-binding protein involved in type VI secretion